jgi:enoyl-CoA hydratase/carnithine racemase
MITEKLIPDTLQIREEGDILWIGLSRPDKRNAFNDALILGIETVFENIPSHIRCAIIYGIGKHFSAGLDLSELKERCGSGSFSFKNVASSTRKSAIWMYP